MSFAGPLAGGALIGLAAAAMLLFLGRMAGVSGVVGGMLVPRRRDFLWRLSFVAGLGAGGVMTSLLSPGSYAATGVSVPIVVAAGLLVGFGTRLGNGCTSGHGVCGVARLSPRSLAATAVFLAAGVVTVFVAGRLGGIS